MPSQTARRGRTAKKGNSSLYLHGSSSISSANPSRIVPITLTNTAKWTVMASFSPHIFSTPTRTVPNMQKATAAANPTHSGIYFSPPLLPFLLMSNPNIFCLSMNSATLGMRAEVNAHAANPAARIDPAERRDKPERAAAEAVRARSKVKGYCFIHVAIFAIISRFDAHPSHKTLPRSYLQAKLWIDRLRGLQQIMYVCNCVDRHEVTQRFQVVIREIREKYALLVGQMRQELAHKERTLQEMEREINRRDEKIDCLLKDIASKDNELVHAQERTEELQKELSSTLQKHSQNEQKLEQQQIKLQQAILLHKKQQQASERRQRQSEKEYEQRMQELVSQLKEYQKRNNDAFSTSASQISRMEASHFSMEISEIFRNCPEELIKFVESMQGERASDPKQVGDMVCMLISRDGMSVDKIYDVNRTFLKRKIKEQEKRFRFVLIYKPDRK